MDFIAYTFKGTTEQQEMLLAQLGDFPFNGFMETDESLLAYLPTSAFSPELEADFTAAADALGMQCSREDIPHQNWNAVWEAAFHPIRVGDLVGIRAEFHPEHEGVQYKMLIHPRMAFGTGHHATTYLMMERMGELDFNDKKTFDFGCGTGILAILAAMMGAQPIDAVDIETESYLNTIENAKVNSVSGITTYEGDLNAVPFAQYDIILANINRNVILDTMEELLARLLPDGQLLISGILAQDVDMVLGKATALGLIPIIQRQKDQWMMIHLMK